ncbi:MAG: cache domain-containing protein [Candidatus Omnitrophota bacterium]
MTRSVLVFGLALLLCSAAMVSACGAQELADYKYQETKDLVSLVRSAAGLVASKGEAAFEDFKKDGSRWRHDKVYVFVMDADGNMLEHPDPALAGKNQIETKDVNGKPVTKGIIEATANNSNKNEGWFHFQWPEPGGIFTGWNSTFAKRITAPSGKTYVICAGLYNIQVEDAFLINAVNEAVALVEREGRKAFGALRDKSSQFVFLGTYIFIDTPQGIEVVNGGFPDVENKNLFDYKDPAGKYLTREVINTAVTKGAGWVDYLWPKPGEAASSRKHTYVKKAVYGDEVFAVGAGAYRDKEAPATAAEVEDIVGKLMILELKSGTLAAGEVLRETSDSIYLEHPDGSMEVSFPRNKIARIRKPTEKELAKIKKDLTGPQEVPAAKPK